MKQIVYYYLLLKILIKAVTCGILFITDLSSLPSIVFAVCITLVVAGVVVSVRYYQQKTKPNEVALFFLAEIIGTCFNLAFVSTNALVETSMFDMLVTGSLLDVILAAIIIATTLKGKTSYINMGKQRFIPQASEVSTKR